MIYVCPSISLDSLDVQALTCGHPLPKARLPQRDFWSRRPGHGQMRSRTIKCTNDGTSSNNGNSNGSGNGDGLLLLLQITALGQSVSQSSWLRPTYSHCTAYQKDLSVTVDSSRLALLRFLQGHPHLQSSPWTPSQRALSMSNGPRTPSARWTGSPSWTAWKQRACSRTLPATTSTRHGSRTRWEGGQDSPLLSTMHLACGAMQRHTMQDHAMGPESGERGIRPRNCHVHVTCHPCSPALQLLI